MSETVSPALINALGGGGINNSLSALYLQNPRLAMAIRRQMEAAPMLAAGMSAEPIRSPWQGVNRLAQALMGGLQARDADQAATTAAEDYRRNLQAAVQGMMGGGAGGPAAAPAAPAAPAMPPAQMEGGAAPASAGNADFISAMTPHALAASRETGVDPRLILAQSALETNWGKSAPGNNYFGIKGPGQTLATNEVVNGQNTPTQASFRAYGNPAESFADYAAFLKSNPRYGAVLKAQGLDPQIDAMGASGYATDPQYGQKLRMIARGINVPTQEANTGLVSTDAAPASPSAAALAGQGAAPNARLSAYENEMKRITAYEALFPGNPLIKAIADQARMVADKRLQAGAWRAGTSSDGRPIMQNDFTGQVEYAPQLQLTPINRMGPNGLERVMVPNNQAANMSSLPDPGAGVQVMTPNGPKIVDQNIPNRVIGTPTLTLDQQVAANTQAGTQQGGTAPTPAQTMTDLATLQAGGKAAGEQAVTDFTTARKAAMAATRQNVQLNRALDAIDKFDPGMTANTKIWAGRLWSALGGNPGNMAEGELLKSIQSALQVGQTHGEGQISNMERQILADRLPVLMATPQGARKAIELAKRLNEMDVGYADIMARNAATNRGAPNPATVHTETMDYLKKLGVDVRGETEPFMNGGSRQSGATPSSSGLPRWNVEKGAWE